MNLDLLFPENMGIPIVLVANLATPDWEKDNFSNHLNGFVVETLRGVILELLVSK